MAGYHGYSMSNNAVEAYKSGEKPISKWTKSEILANIEKQIQSGIIPGFTMNPRLIPASVLKELFLYKSSWHHTSSRYNHTNFYSYNDERLESLDDYYLNRCIKDDTVMKENRQKRNNTVQFGVITVQVWGGTRTRPKIIGYDTQAGIVKGDWLHYPGGKYKTHANKVEFFKILAWPDLIKQFPQYKGKKSEILKAMNTK